MNVSAALTLALAVTAAVGTQDSTYSLDLVDSPATTDEEYREASRHSRALLFYWPYRGRMGSEQPPVPLTVTLLSLDRGVYDAGDDITYEFVVRNTGAAPIYIPASRLAHHFTIDMPRAARASFGLSFDDDVLGWQRIGGDVTFGADSVPGSLLRLEQNQSVTIRVKSGVAIQSTGNPARPYPWLRVVNVRLSFGLYPVHGEPHGEVMSANSHAIELRSSSDGIDVK